jgi:hypothetical protein
MIELAVAALGREFRRAATRWRHGNISKGFGATRGRTTGRRIASVRRLRRLRAAPDFRTIRNQ